MRSGLAAAVVSLALVGACSPAAPTVPTDPGAPAITAIEITGPDTMAPGDSAQFIAVIVLSDGVRKTASGTDVQWGFNTLFMRVNATGLATALDRVGDTTVSAHVQAPRGQITGTRVVTIVPTGTFRVIGRVSDAEATSVPIPGALVEVTPGSIATTTNFEGEYKLYGVLPGSIVRVSKTGFQLVERHLNLTAHATQNFDLPPDGPRPDLSGPYTLAIDIGGACAESSLLLTLRNRRYDAVLTRTGGTVEVVLVESRFQINSIGRGNRFTGVVYSGGATFTLFGFDFDNPDLGPLTYPNVAERLSDGTFLVPSGTVAMVGDAAGLTGQMGGGGFVSRFGAGFPTPATFLGGCNFQSPIVVTLTPR